MIKNYFKTAWRNILKNKTVAVINIFGLTLGITACLVIYLDTKFELTYDNFHLDKERIYRAVSWLQESSGDKNYKPSVPKPMAVAIRSDFTGIEKVAQFHIYYAKVLIPIGDNDAKRFDAPNKDDDEPSDVIISDPEYFGIFKYQWLAGNATSMKDPFRVVLTESKAKKYFGSLPLNEMIGKEIIYNDSLRLSVSGIVKDFPKNSAFIFNDFISSSTIANSFLKDNFNFTNWQSWNGFSQTFIKVTKGTTIQQFEKQTLGLVKKNMDVGNGIKVNISLQPLSDIHFNNDYKAYYGRTVHLATLYALMMVAVFILLIAVINFTNLSTAQLLQRAKEIGVRKVFGSSRSKIIVMFLCETFILTFVSLILSVVIISPLIKAFHAFLPDGVVLAFSGYNIAFILLIILVTALFAGIYPGKVLSAYLPVIALKGANSYERKGKTYLQKGLIVFQFTISLVFIIGTLIMGNQIRYVLNADMGFSKDAIINIRTPQKFSKEKMQVFAQQIKQLPQVQMVSICLGTPAEDNHWSTILKKRWTDDEEGIGAQFLAGDVNYLSLYHLKLLAGRNLLPSDTMKEYLISETLAKQLGFKNPEDAIGKTVSGGGDDGEASHKQLPIVGVLADFHQQSLHEQIAPTFMSTSKKYSGMISVKLVMNGKQLIQFGEATTNIEGLWKNIYANEKFEYKFYDQTIAKFYDTEMKTEKLMNTATAIAIFISCMGLFGLVTSVAQQRTKEIGIRKVLGASAPRIVAMLSFDFISLVLLASVVASPIAYYFMDQWLQDFAYRINISWWVFAIAGIIAALIAFITISFQAIKAAIANPVKSLRTE
jgi:ABC-type antimicrobial peptide transport system permease subunit